MKNFQIIIISIIFSSLCAMSISLNYKIPELDVGDKISDYENEKVQMENLYIKNNLEFENPVINRNVEKCLQSRTILKTYDMLNYSEPNASKIMKNFIYEDLERNVKDQVELNRLRNLVKNIPVNAFEYDLNDDGIKEVIGLPPLISFYSGSIGASFFILQKTGDVYIEIENYIQYTYEDEIVILQEKTNGYHHMQFRKKNQPKLIHIIKYIDKSFQSVFC